MHPVDQLLIIYRLAQSEYDKPDIRVTTGSTPVGVIEGLEIDWGFVAG